MQIIFIVAVTFAVFFEMMSFGTQMLRSAEDRAIKIIGDAVLSSDCLVEMASDNYPIKGLFSESKISTNPSCINYPADIYIDIASSSVKYGIGNPSVIDLCQTNETSCTAQFPAAIKFLDGRVEPALVILYKG